MMGTFRDELISLVADHKVLTSNPWLEQREKRMERSDLLLWLKQEYFVSVAFVNWFLNAAAISDSVSSKIVLVENIWEELGEGKEDEAHVSLLKRFLAEMEESVTAEDLLPETAQYLGLMQRITTTDFLAALGALGPANEYLLKLEYGRMFLSYKELKSRILLPDGKFFQVNLDADESHSEKLFRLIQEVADDEPKRERVREGAILALNARLVFYDGLQRIAEPISKK
ncbi:Iron-containing redox enzyme [Leptospira broomii serovar Hurstbridge str. 5399]|uniref:Iron-containing redox enzyme n=2 Tax=Leptospira broomii TaxID=301541 RepID=T0F9I0_9LEPT|nr:Iron-containing redox enzyme [Leptospira broomii serovar Hurstbridge str. 5399]